MIIDEVNSSDLSSAVTEEDRKKNTRRYFFGIGQ